MLQTFGSSVLSYVMVIIIIIIIFKKSLLQLLSRFLYLTYGVYLQITGFKMPPRPHQDLMNQKMFCLLTRIKTNEQEKPKKPKQC